MYAAGQESEQRGQPTHAITWGHSKARRPDLKQLLYNLTVTSDGNVPVYFSTAGGNTVGWSWYPDPDTTELPG